MQNPKDDVLYAPVEWVDYSEGYSDIRYHKSTDGIAKITINRPEVRNAFRPQTVKEMISAFSDARFDEKIGVIVLTGEGEKAFCSGGDQKVRGDYGGYKDDRGVHHLNVLDFQRDIRSLRFTLLGWLWWLWLFALRLWLCLNGTVREARGLASIT